VFSCLALTGEAITNGHLSGFAKAEVVDSSPPDRPPVLLVDGVSKSFRVAHERAYTLKERALHPFRSSEHHVLRALDDVSFVLGSGEWFGIIGRNGSGKSTLLKCIAGIYRADEGRIAASGKLSPFIELGVGFNPNLRARDNILLNGVMLGLTPERARECYDEVIEFAGLEEFVDLKLKNYSSGMQVRLAFAVMAQVDADVMLIDEVLAVGDAVFQRKCLETIDRRREQGCGVVFVTHDMDAIVRTCDRALLLERGRMVKLGDPAEVASAYERLNFPEETGE
jgi:ABC-type polysaccharide/polyol phosphate transport system ATPase subunit